MKTIKCFRNFAIFSLIIGLIALPQITDKAIGKKMDDGGLKLIATHKASNDVWNVVVDGKYAYLNVGRNMLEIVDISDHASIKSVSKLDAVGMLKNVGMPKNKLESVKDVFVSGKYAYLLDADKGLQVIDVSVPGSPVFAGVFDTWGQQLFVKDNLAYVSKNETLQILDVEDPKNIREVGKLRLEGNVSADGILLVDNKVYFAKGKDGLKIVDVSDPAAPALAGEFKADGGVMEIAVEGKYAYLADFMDGLSIVDVSNPASIKMVSSIKTPSSLVKVMGNHAYVGGTGLRVINISNPAQPKEVAKHICFTADIEVANNYVYVAAQNYGLLVFDVSGLK